MVDGAAGWLHGARKLLASPRLPFPPSCSLVAQQPLRRHIVRSANVLPRALADVLKAPRPPFSFLSGELQAVVAQ